MRAIASFGLTFAVAGGLRYLDQPLWFAVLMGVAIGVVLPVFLQQWIASRRR